MQQFAPGQWLVRIVPPGGPMGRNKNLERDILQFDFLARTGFLEKREERVNIGPLLGVQALEYRATTKGWMNSLTSLDSSYRQFPCFYFGIERILRIASYTESAADADGVRTLKVKVLYGTQEPEDWAKSEEAKSLFPAIKTALEGREGELTLYRAPNGKLAIAKHELSRQQYLEDKTEHAANQKLESPKLEDVRQGIKDLENSPGQPPYQTLPSPCLPLTVSKYGMPPIWKAGEDGGSRRVAMPPEGDGQARLFYARLIHLEKAGMISLSRASLSSRWGVGVQAQPHIAELLKEHGPCLPLGSTKIEVLAVLPDDQRGRIRFKARYVVTEPSAWILATKSADLLPDLSVLLGEGLPFEGTIFKGPRGWRAGYIASGYPTPQAPKLSSVGTSAAWSEATPPDMSTAVAGEHDFHYISATGVSATVDVARSARPMVIVLSADNLMQWHFNVQRGANIAMIFAFGPAQQSVHGLSESTRVISAIRGGARFAEFGQLTDASEVGAAGLFGMLAVTPKTTQQTVAGRKAFIESNEDVLKSVLEGRR